MATGTTFMMGIPIRLGTFICLLISYLFLPISSLDIQLQERKVVSVERDQNMLISTRFQASTYRYLILQTVSQKSNISVSYNNHFMFNNHINGTARGLVYMLNGGQNSIDAYLTSTKDRVTSQVITIPYLRTDPIPGGCCITCNFDNDPNIYVKKDLLTIKLSFERANVFFDPGKTPKSCDGGSLSTFVDLEYELYAYQLTENDFTEGNLFNGVWKMAYPRNIKKYGKLIATIRGHTSPKLVLQMIPHQGLVYNVLVRDSYEKSEAAYVPAFAYDCDINNVETCKSFGSVTSIVFAAFCGIIGLGLCFIGHKFFKFELFIAGVISGFFITYIMILRFSEIDYLVHMVSSTVAGVALGLLIIILYLSTTHIHIFLLNNAVLIGAMVACCVLFSPLTELKAFSNNSVYLPTFFAIAFVIAIPLLFFPKFTSILFSSLIGGYMTVLSCSFFIHANLQFLVIEFILRSGIPSFADAYLRVPFQQNEFILCGAWGVLLFAGGFSQYYLTRKEIFPPKSKRGNRRSKSGVFGWFKRRRGVTNRMFDERTPLIQNESFQYQNGDSWGESEENGPRRKQVYGQVI